MTVADYVPTTADILARRARLGWPQVKPVFIPLPPEPVEAVEPEPEPKPPTKAQIRAPDAVDCAAIARSIMTLTEIDGPSGKEILARVSKATNVSMTDLITSRHQKPALARQLAMWLMVKRRGLTLRQVASIVGRDHTTVIHAVRRIEELRSAAS